MKKLFDLPPTIRSHSLLWSPTRFWLGTAFGWGQDGHRITAEIAERNLTPEAEAALREIPGNERLAEISAWPDEIRSDGTRDFAKPWHYISIDDEESRGCGIRSVRS